MKNKLFIALILCVLAACNSKAEYSGKVETQQDFADCWKAADLARIDYLKREGSLPEGLEDTILAYGDEHFLNAAAFAIRGLTANPTGQEERARRALRNPSATAYYSACELAYLTGEEVDWPDY